MFEQVIRLKLRFESAQGLITAEDLWDLPLTSERKANLNDIAIGLSRKLKDSENESFVVKATPKNEELQLKFDAVKHIIAVRLAEAEHAKQLKENREKKERILGIIEKKQNEQLEGATLEELQGMVNSL
jgi:hypothetical protein